MTTRKTITVTLTEPQYMALASAVSGEALELEERWAGNDPNASRQIDVLNRAWSKIRDAWNGRTP